MVHLVHSGHIFKLPQEANNAINLLWKMQADIYVFMILVFKKNTFLNSVDFGS